MLKCDIQTHSTAIMMKHFNINPRQVMHIGAHDGLELAIYQAFGSSKNIWFECNPFVFEDLVKRIEEEAQDEINIASHECLFSKDNATVEYHFYQDRKNGAGGLYEDDKMHQYVNCPMTGEKISMKTTKLDTWINNNLYLTPEYTDFLNIDVQGAELEVFKGATNFLSSKNLMYIWCEVSWGPVYKKGPHELEIIDYLRDFGFHPLAKRRDWELHGDILFGR